MRFEHSLRAVRCAMVVLVPVVALSAQGWVQRNTPTAPAARNSHAMAYDSARGVAVLFGGYDGTNTSLGDTWEWNGFGWVPRAVALAPSPRTAHSMVYDSRRLRTVLFGGHIQGSGYLNDTWEWDGSTWRQVLPLVSPPIRGFSGMAYDSVRGRAVLFGGVDNSGSRLGDTWEFDGSTWTQVAASSAPSARSGVAMAFDDTRGETVLFGGGTGAQVFADTWTFNGSSWSQEFPATSPTPRWESRLQHDTLCGLAVLHGGADAGYSSNYGDSWSWDGTDWVSLAGTGMPGRHGGALAFDAQRGQMVAFGGRGGAGFYGDTWHRASPCSRTMSVVTAPQVGSMAAFRFDYPLAAAGHWYFHLLTAHQQVPYAVPIPGFTSIGVSRVDLFNIYLQPSGLLDASGTNVLNVGIPPDNALVGLLLDVQTVDLNFLTNTLYWAGNDVEVSIAPVIPPVASFSATPTLGAALPLAVQFTDTSTNGPTSWQWDFDNDGLVDSTQQHPTHSYTNAGFYSVRLTSANISGASTSLRSNLITAGPLPNPLLNMIPIAAGTFQMGSPVTPLGSAPYANQASAQPVHAVTITLPFWIGKYEVTQSEYQAVMGSNPSFFVGPQRPVEQVSWNNAMAYCVALTTSEASAGRVPAGYQYRLPTEAEWEYCYRAGTTTEFWFGSTIACGQANFNFNQHTNSSCGIGQTTDVGTYPVNPWGLYDLAGNVFEWCLDSWDGSANYPPSALSDPYVSIGPDRVVRGGSWSDYSKDCRAAYRNGGSPGRTGLNIGFRVVLAPVLVPPVASFTATPTTGTLPLVVQFTDASTNAPTSWQWDFDNDGLVDSTQQHPTHIYTVDGLYSVRLIAANIGGESTSLRSNLVHAGPIPSPLLNMVPIGAGTFQMGSTGVGGRAVPVHAVTITQPFWVGKYEVTQAEYQALMGSNPSNFVGPQLPVETVSWTSAMAYCAALTATEAAAGRVPAGYQYRLPTEAEWEYFCRAGTTTEWNTGTSLVCGQANFSGCGPGQTTVVGSYAANPWGLFDTHGNVWEWCLDSWDLSANYPSSAVSDPYGPSGFDRVVRGGSWVVAADICRSAARGWAPPGYSSNEFGFRVVLAPVLVP